MQHWAAQWSSPPCLKYVTCQVDMVHLVHMDLVRNTWTHKRCLYDNYINLYTVCTGQYEVILRMQYVTNMLHARYVHMVYPLHIDLLLIEVYMIVITTCIQSVLVYMRLLHMHHVPNMLHVRYIWCIWYTLTWLEAQGPAIEAYMTVTKACIWS